MLQWSKNVVWRNDAKKNETGDHYPTPSYLTHALKLLIHPTYNRYEGASRPSPRGSRKISYTKPPSEFSFSAGFPRTAQWGPRIEHRTLQWQPFKKTSPPTVASKDDGYTLTNPLLWFYNTYVKSPGLVADADSPGAVADPPGVYGLKL